MLFSHDGIHDSQTHLSSPSYFYEQLRREILIAARTHKPLALVKILFSNPESDQVQARDVLHFAYELTQLTRQEECVGRLGVNEVVIIVRDGKSHAEKLVQRLLQATSLTVDHRLQIKLFIVLGTENETGLSLLSRLDRAEVCSIHSAG
jgi:GGDEF domain-containing protein